MKSFLAVFLCFILTISFVNAESLKLKDYHLVWSDEFTSKELDLIKWDFQQATEACTD